MQRLAVFKKGDNEKLIKLIKQDYVFIDFLTDLDNFYVIYSSRSAPVTLSTTLIETFFDNSFVSFFDFVEFAGVKFKVIGKGQVFGFGGRCIGDQNQYYSRVFYPNTPINRGKLVVEYKSGGRPITNIADIFAKVKRWDYDLLAPCQNKRGAMRFFEVSGDNAWIDFELPVYTTKIILKVLFYDRFEIRRISLEEGGL